MSANNKNFVCKNVGGMGVEECIINIRDERNKNGENVICDQVDNKIFKLDTLENLCKDYELPDFIKIDVEGAEKNILINSEIIKTTKYIIVEWNQPEKINDFLLKYLPNFELLGKFGNDYLLKNIIIK
jgi:FkbM family methyltransferase